MNVHHHIEPIDYTTLIGRNNENIVKKAGMF